MPMKVYRKPYFAVTPVGCPTEAVAETAHLALNSYTPLLCCGFECGEQYRLGAGFGTNAHTGHWFFDENNGTATFDTATPRSGRYCLRINNVASDTFAQSAYPQGTLPQYHDYVVRFYVRFNTLPNTNCFINYISGLGHNCGIAYNYADSKLYCAFVGEFNYNYPFTPVLFGATGVSVTTDVWYRIDLRVIIDNSPPFTSIEGKVDGVDLGGLTNSYATQYSPGYNTVVLGPGTTITGDVLYDDYILSFTSADYPFGAGNVLGFTPRCDGTHNAGTNLFRVGASGAFISDATIDSYLLVDDIPVNLGNVSGSDYINQISNGASNYLEHRYGPFEPRAHPTVPPRAVDVLIQRSAASNSIGNSLFKVADNGTEDTIVTQGAVANSLEIYTNRKHYANPPSGLGGWKIDGQSGNFKQLRHRFGYSSDANPDQYFVGTLIEAEFPE
jgi:hypothetical protein